MEFMIYDHRKIEEKWRQKWLEEKIYQPDLERAKKPFYNLMMFPYPSAEGLHVGNMYAFTGADVYGRFKRMSGYDVFEPIGLDGFGIHSENYAIKVGRHPAQQAKVSEKRFYDQLSKIGNGFAWDQRLETYDPEYYRWTQWLFIQMFKRGLAYRGKALVNWCPSCKTVLADEQVEAGVCERCKSQVVKKEMEQWFFKITAYADRLLENLDKIDWPKKIKVAQRNWIGRSEGHIVRWQMVDDRSQIIETFTTRIDTLLGVTFLVVAEGKESGYKVIHPVTGEELPVLAADYVVADYGTGAVMGVPATDERDREFAKAHGLEIRKFKPFKPQNEAFVKPEVRYHLRDWLISRQRYWGPPIPMIHCDDCGWQPVPEEELPVVLPEVKEWRPGSSRVTGKSPLETAPESWLYAKCPNCGKRAKRETDVSDTFLDSAWYFLRYPSIGHRRSKFAPFDAEMTKKWLPVDAYIGGAEHAVLHLLYSRFVWMALKDWGYLRGIDSDEPFPFLFSHGLIIKDGAKMSKSRGNIVNPDEYIERYGVDALRMYLMFVGPYDQGGDFRDTGMVGMYRFLERVWRLFQGLQGTSNKQQATHPELERKLHQTIKKVTEDLGKFKYNTAIAALMELTNSWQQELKQQATSNKKQVLSREDAIKIVKLLAPLAPYVAEELFQRLNSKLKMQNVKFRKEGSVHLQSWPEWEGELVKEEEATVVVQVNGKVRASLEVKRQMASSKEQVVVLSRQNRKIQRWLEGKKIKSVVWVEGKLINFVLE